MAVPVALAQRQTTDKDWVVVGRGEQEAADDEQRQKVRLGVMEAASVDQRRVRLEGRSGWGLETTADDQRQRCVLLGEVRQCELESARREGEGEGAPQQQSTACQNGRRTRSVGLEALGRC